MTSDKGTIVGLVPIETHSTFRLAADHARDLAIEFQTLTGLQRAHAGWQVLIAADVAKVIRDYLARDAADDFDSDLDETEDERWEQSERDESIAVERDLTDELREEFSSGMDDWGRSEETGWCYGDDD